MDAVEKSPEDGGGYMGTEAESCSCKENCAILKEVKEENIESLRKHLSEQRHDFLNLLQVIYGYTQLKKTDKVLEYISKYSRRLENIGRVYNSKCIKLADLLYNKEKEAECASLNFEVNAQISFEPAVWILDGDELVAAVDKAVTAYLYALWKNNCSDSTVIFDLKENADNFTMEIYCREIRDRELDAFAAMPEAGGIYSSRFEKNVENLSDIIDACSKSDIEAQWIQEDSTFVMKVLKKVCD